MGAARGVVRVRRDALAARMTCPLCQGLLREATAITQCLHTFCRECIMGKINDEDVDCCPVCNIDLGCDPEEKLRPDHNLQDIRNKLFPIKKKKVDSPKVSTTLPAKRKQRSLSSLVVDTPSIVMRNGLTGKRTKTKRRATASRVTSPNNNGTMKVPAKSAGRDQKTEKTSEPQSMKVATTAKKNESRDQKKKKTSAQQSIKAATTANKKQRNTDAEVSSKPSYEDRKNAKTADKEELQKPSNRPVHTSSKTKAPRTTPKFHATIEVKIKKKEGEVPIRKEETENDVNIPGTRVGEHPNKPNHKEENNGGSSESAPLTDQTTAKGNSNQGFSGPASTLRDPIATPIWFSLVSSPNLKGGPELPALSKSFLRIKDGGSQISSVQRYIAKKLDLVDENEVEIICRGEPISPSSTLQGLVELWRRREPAERVQASLGAPAKEFVMALGYRRRPCLVPSTAVSPPGETCTAEALSKAAKVTAPPESA
ncbi:hypothetical protein HU200_057511 [Digitaria exilis]|uniref:RING-type domain-containing protein n=1 Tax=Digitaria exilis TaxID=1010633 RepID=A0A835E1E8_9POAL|nr:hypothetical protein HU200_057511 [Digitaria exilis]